MLLLIVTLCIKKTTLFGNWLPVTKTFDRHRDHNAELRKTYKMYSAGRPFLL